MTATTEATGTNTERYQVVLQAGRHELVADEPTGMGGEDAGPAPFGLVLAGLAACTAITLRMYAERKDWPLGDVRVELALTGEPGEGQEIARTLHLAGDLDDEQRARLLDIAGKTPVTRSLQAGMAIPTTLG